MIVRRQAVLEQLLEALKSILSSLESPEGVELQVLKRLYYLLVSLSLDMQAPCSNVLTSSYCGEGLMYKFKFELMFTHIRMISDVIFKELEKKFKQLFSGLGGASVIKDSLHSEIWVAADELNVVLRCCLVILNLLEPEQIVMFEKCQILLAIFKRLCSQDLMGHMECAVSVEKSREGTHSRNNCATSFSEKLVGSLHFSEHVDPILPFVSMVLEVFLDELLVHRTLRKHFLVIDSFSSTSEKLFVCCPSIKDVASVLEVISAHFLLSVSGEQALEKFLNGLFCLHEKSYRSPELSLNAALSLLDNPLMLSAPKNLQAHLISLVTEAIGIARDSVTTRQDSGFIGSCLSAFERAVILYSRHISALLGDHHPFDDKGSYAKSSNFVYKPSFGSLVHPVTSNRLNTATANLNCLWNSYLRHTLFRTKADLLTTLIAFMKENEYMLDKNCKDDIAAVLSSLIVRALPEDVNDVLLQKIGEVGDTILLASLLKLISISMLQAICSMRHLRSLQEFSSCKEYGFLLDIIGRFQQLNVPVPIQKFLYEATDCHSSKHKGSKLMLLHFSGMLSLSFSSGYEFLVKGCVFVMMGLTVLLSVDEGALKELNSLSCGSESVSSVLSSNEPESVSARLSPNAVQEALEDQTNTSSRIIASKFQRTRMLLLRNAPASELYGMSRDPGEDSSKCTVSFESSTGGSSIKATEDASKCIACISSDFSGWPGETSEDVSKCIVTVESESRRMPAENSEEASKCIDYTENESGGRVAETSDDASKFILGIEDRSEETCTGEIFLRCVIQGNERSADIDDLSDFVECESGKDYGSWLKSRERFRKWRHGKKAALRWEKVKNAWKLTKRRKT